MISCDEILKALAFLNKSELGKVKKRIEFLMGERIEEASSPLLSALLAWANKYVKVPDINYIYRNDPKSFAKFQTCATLVEELANELELDRAKIHKLCKLVIEAGALKVTEELHLPLSFRTLAIFIKDPRYLLEESFPGYIHAGVFIHLLE